MAETHTASVEQGLKHPPVRLVSGQCRGNPQIVSFVRSQAPASSRDTNKSPPALPHWTFQGTSSLDLLTYCEKEKD